MGRFGAGTDVGFPREASDGGARGDDDKYRVPDIATNAARGQDVAGIRKPSVLAREILNSKERGRFEP